ncbi:DNA repair protein RecN [Phycicoccus sonneratiae]|uniref:DNA repair protein RecN n=1 Tax=Phycicoccus sonneratiae TaxID=2807628 RepID=A0ABS2CHP1_9MICO|nr:DNA repair protein RecN [Phycicoccus sonneraticus]MBM6399392.1 DNA repair protein RecN [Phycicoccus sonneraticus]
MIEEIRIRDLGVIDEAVLPLHRGLTVLTGETGAGKTMVVTALGLLLGGRGDSGLVRAGAQRTVVEGLVDLPEGHAALVRAEEAGADTAEGLVLVRSVTADGRSRAHVGGRAAPVGVLAELAEHLVAVHGQADQWRLRRADEHREVLDAFGGPDLAAALEEYRQVHTELLGVESELEELRAAAAERAREAETLRVGLERIEAVDPQPGEDESLRAESDRLGHAEELRTAAGGAHDVLSGEPDGGAGGAGVVEALAAASARIAAASANDAALAALGTRVDELRYLAADVAADLGAYLADADVDPARLDQVEQRRAALGDLTRLYGPGVDDVLAWGSAAAARVTELEGTGDRIGELEERAAALGTRREAAAAVLGEHRRTAAEALGARITDELGHLSMGAATVTVAVEDTGRYGAEGREAVEVRLASGPGTQPRSVTKAASGGELSRVMLAIEVATADAVTSVPTFVFDEVDAGVGGRAAVDVGARLAALARHAQVVVVTHLAQVAAHADRHLVVEKSDDGHVTRSMVHAVEGEERVAELARMLGGSGTRAALDHARDLLGRARA